MTPQLEFINSGDGVYQVRAKGIMIGEAFRHRGRWRGITKSGGVVITRAKTRLEAGIALYWQRFGHSLTDVKLDT